MKVMIDAHNLSLKEPTGLGAYTYNLALCLNELGHDVSALYSMNSWKSQFPSNAIFYQRLAIEGESSSDGLFKWVFRTFPYVLSILSRQGIKPIPIRSHYDIPLIDFERKLPKNVSIYNLPHIFRSAQAFAAISRMSMPVGVPNDTNKLDIFHCTSPLPLSKGKFKKIVTLHDLIPLKIPQSTAINLKHYENIIRTSLKDADLIFAISEQTKKDAIDILKINENRIYVTYQNSDIPEMFINATTSQIEPICDTYKLKIKNYFIYHGAIEPKKNISRLIEAFSQAETDCKLVIIGKNGWLFEKESELLGDRHINERIVRIPYCDFPRLMYLLNGARALIFPSLYEGFGLPVLEAMQVGTPVITSNQGSLPEIAGTATHLVNPYSISDIRAAIEKFSENDEILEQMSISGKKQAKKFSKSEYQKRLLAGYEKVFE